MTLLEAIEDGIKTVSDSFAPCRPYCFITGGTGLEDKRCVEFYADTNVIVCTRDGKRYQYGRLIENEVDT